jgi:putative flippase GtrA
MPTQAEPAVVPPAGPTKVWRLRVSAAMRHSAFRYAVTGVLSAGADFGLLYALHSLLGLALPIAAFIAVAAAFVFNYLLNRVWSFGSNAPVGREFVRYVLLGCVNWVLTAILVSLLTSAGLYFMVAKMITLVLTTGGNYLLYRVWVFAGRYQRQAADEAAGG